MGLYSEWLQNVNAKDHVLENLRKSGVPLELQARRKLTEHGFHATNFRYFQSLQDEVESLPGFGSGIWRELDLHAYRSEPECVQLKRCEIAFYTHIIGECKYSAEKDLLVFEHLDLGNADLSHFPLLVNGHYILSGRILARRFFKLPLLVDRVVEVDHKSDTKKDGNFSDATTHSACEQLLAALRFFMQRERESKRIEYHGMAKSSAISGIWDEWRDQGKVEYQEHGSVTTVNDAFIQGFLEQTFDPDTMLDDFRYVAIDLVFPVIVIDEARGVLRVKLNDSHEPIDLDDVGLCLYLYVSENANRYELVLDNSFALPVLICNLSQLDQALNLISEGMKQVIQETERQVTTYPYCIPQEVVFTKRLLGRTFM